MALTQVTGPYPIFTDLDGSPLDDGYLFIGDANDDPETNPTQVFWDSALTIPATQPIRTNNGYAWRNGAPGLIYTDGPFSITIRNKRNEFVLYSPVGYGFDPAAVAAAVVKNDFTGDGVEVNFTLSASPSTVLATNIYINGVYQEKDSYTLVGNTITFSVAPPVGSSIEVITTETGVINVGNANSISYTAGFPGASAQTVQTKLEQFVTVKDFGAVGDGATDDTAAFIAAPLGAYIPAGTYLVTSTVNKEFEFMDNASIIGAGSETVYPRHLKSYNQNFVLASFFTDTNFANRPLGLHSSNDGINFKHLIDIRKDKDGTAWSFGDPALFVKDEMFYVAFTNSKVNEYDFCVARSSNFMDWEVVECTLGSTPVCKTNGTAPGGWTYQFATGPEIWAPEFFEDTDGKIYVTISIQCTANQPTIEPFPEPYFRQFIAECTDLSALTFTTATELRINGRKGIAECSDIDNVIDGSIIRHPDGRYIMALKDEYNKTINVFSATTLTGNWAQISTNIFPLAPYSTPNYTEAPCITPMWYNGAIRYYIYADKYVDKNIYYVVTDDFITYTTPETIENQSLARHGSAINLGFLPRETMNWAVNALSKTYTFLPTRPTSEIVAYKNLKDVPDFPTFTDFPVENGTLYRMFEDTPEFEVEISGLPGDTDMPDGSYFYVLLAMGNFTYGAEPRRLTFTAGCTNFTPSTRPTTFGQHNGYADCLIKFVKTESVWRIESMGPIDEVNGRASDYILFENLADFPDLNNGSITFYPYDTFTYVTYGTSIYAATTTVHSLPIDVYADGASFFVTCRSSDPTKGIIVMKAGSHAWWPSDITIDSTLDARLIEFRFIDGKWAKVS